MTGSEMLSNLILSINQKFGTSDPIVVENITIDGNIKVAIVNLLPNVANSNIQIFLNSLSKIFDDDKDSFLTTPYTIVGQTEVIDFTNADFDKKNRAFSFSDIDFGFFSTKAMFDTNVLVNLDKDSHGLLWKQMQEFLTLCYLSADVAKENLLLDAISNANKNVGFVLNKHAIPFIPQTHYAYIYLKFLNSSNSVELPTNLRSSNPVLNNTLALDNTKIYEQYFDIYDVLNELNQAPDLLSRFLKLYHIIEYLVYRVYLVDLVTRVGNSKFFVREYAVSAEKMKGSESATFSKNFEAIFSSEILTITADLGPHTNPAVILFLKEKGIVSGFDQTDIKKVSKLVYGLRCSIVHNKESEYHMTITNHEDYEEIIPLMRKLIETMEFLVVKKVAENFPLISYTQPQVKLY